MNLVEDGEQLGTCQTKGAALGDRKAYVLRTGIGKHLYRERGHEI